jgi:hypothetical protein
VFDCLIPIRFPRRFCLSILYHFLFEISLNILPKFLGKSISSDEEIGFCALLFFNFHISYRVEYATSVARGNNNMKITILDGYSHVDLSAARELGIAVTNAPGYSTDAVAQHTIALLMELTNQVGLHNQAVQDGAFLTTPTTASYYTLFTCFPGKPWGLSVTATSAVRSG